MIPAPVRNRFSSQLVQLRPPDGPWRSTLTGHRVTRDETGSRPWQTRSRPWTIPAELTGRFRARRLHLPPHD
jgi:hypothetical protein